MENAPPNFAQVIQQAMEAMTAPLAAVCLVFPLALAIRHAYGTLLHYMLSLETEQQQPPADDHADDNDTDQENWYS